MTTPIALLSAPMDVGVLHVDDSPADLYRRRRPLEAAGFRVVDAASAAAARSLFRTQHVDLLLLDVRLPETTGFDLARDLKADALAAQRDIGVILVSAYFTEAEYRVQGLESGADAYLAEPVTDAELIASIKAVARRLEQLKAARRNEQLLDALFKYIPAGIGVAGKDDTTMRRVSPYGLAMLGISREEMESLRVSGRTQRWGIFARDGSVPAMPEDLPLERAIRTGAVITDEEWVVRGPDGRQITVACNAGPIQDGAGRVTGGVIAWHDITARKAVERTLHARTEELRLANQAKNDFLARVVHELRQPVSAAVAAVGLMKARPDRESGERARDVIDRQLRQMSRIIDDLLDTTRIVRGEVSFQMGSYDLCAIVRRSVETATSAAQERGVGLSAVIPTFAILVAADECRLEQVFVNLLSNAIRYTPSGGNVEISIQSTPSEAVIRVRDDGEGIATERLPRIFDLFVRGHGSGGLGIGLAVSKALVEAHGGRIDVHSDGPGRGSEFTVTLPCDTTDRSLP